MSTQAFGARGKCLNRGSGMKGDSAGHRTFSGQLITVTTHKQHARFHGLYRENLDLSSRTGLSVVTRKLKSCIAVGPFYARHQTQHQMQQRATPQRREKMEGLAPL